MNTSTKLGAAAAASIAAVAWVGYQIAAPTPDTTDPGHTTESVLDGMDFGGSPSQLPSEGRRAGLPVDERRPVGSPVTATAAVEAPGPAQFPLEVSFELPDRSKPKLPNVSATLTLAAGEQLYVEASDAKGLRFEDIPLGRHELAIVVSGYKHRTEWLDYGDLGALEQGQNDNERVFQHRATLWPEDWIPLVVRTRDGQPFKTLATDLGYEPKRFFVHAFELAVGLEPFSPGMAFPGNNEYGTFRPPPGYQNVEIGGSVGGSIHLLQAPPLWAGLWIHGVFFENRMVDADDEEITFEISQADLDARFATVRLRVVDAASGAPVSDVEATLKANTSAHRRHDLQEQVPSPDGQLAFQRVIPGAHELSIWREGNTAQRLLELAPGQALDLGDVPIGSGPGIALEIVDVDGEPCRAYVELAPYEAGKPVDELYHPNLHRGTNADGEYLLPVPDRLSILRVRPFGAPARRAGSQLYYGGSPQVGTPNILIDPDNAPLQLRVEARERVEVSFDPLTPWHRRHRLSVHDELDLIVAEINDRSDEGLRTELVEGRYRVHRWDGDVDLGVVDVVVAPGTERLPAP